MKYGYTAVAIIILVFTACNSAQTEAQATADAIEKTMKENTPGAVATSANGYYMTATVDGKEWKATHMLPLNAASDTKLVRGENDGSSISLHLWRPSLKLGLKRSFSPENPAGISLTDDPAALVSGNVGEVEITKFDDQWLEGKFHFSATGTSYDAAGSSSKKTAEVTEGRFRVPYQ